MRRRRRNPIGKHPPKGWISAPHFHDPSDPGVFYRALRSNPRLSREQLQIAGERIAGLRRRYRSLARGRRKPSLTEAQYVAANFGDIMRGKRFRNPRALRAVRHFDKCVAEVRAKGGAVNPYAVCNAAMKKRRRAVRRTNPRYQRSSASVLNRPDPLFALLAKPASGKGKTLVYDGAKFTSGGRPALFKTQALAATVARFLRLKYPVLKNYAFYAKEMS